jgi:hypothetical protein
MTTVSAHHIEVQLAVEMNRPSYCPQTPLVEGFVAFLMAIQDMVRPKTYFTFEKLLTLSQSSEMPTLAKF